MSIERLQPGARMSEATMAQGFVFLAGQVAEDPREDIAGQTRQVLAAIDKLLAEAGSDKTNILMATIYIVDMSEFALMNAVWDQWVVIGKTPARATVQAGLARPGWKIEIAVVAIKK